MTLWYAFCVAQGVLWFAGRVTTGSISVTDADAVSKLHQQGMLYLGGGAAAAIATVFAVMAMHRIDAINAGE